MIPDSKLPNIQSVSPLLLKLIFSGCFQFSRQFRLRKNENCGKSAGNFNLFFCKIVA